MSELAIESEISAYKTLLNQAVESLSTGIIQSGIFSEGTYENIMEAHEEECARLQAKLKKKRLSASVKKEINAFCDVMKKMRAITQAIGDLAWKEPMINNVKIDTLNQDAELSKGFLVAHKETIKKLHDVAKVLLLQKNSAQQLGMINSMLTVIIKYNSYTDDIANPESLLTLVKEVDALERLQTSDRRKELMGKILRVIGWGIIIFATLITLNPGVSLTVVGISLGLTIVGGVINQCGQRLQKPRAAKTQLYKLYETLSFFRNNSPADGNSDAEAKEHQALLQPTTI